MDKIIYNCHTHLFTHEHVPDRYFLNLPVIRWLRKPFLRAFMPRFLKAVIPWSRSDRLNRFAAFMHAAFRDSQADNFAELVRYYPDDTRFIVLPMDMAEMGAGPVKTDIDAQHAELAALAAEHPGRIIPFAHIDPRHGNPGERLRQMVETHGFRGVKIYPPLGYNPADPVLMESVYPYMVEKNLPLMSHCSPGIVTGKNEPAYMANRRTRPDKYVPVMDAFPDLRICLAHFGGDSDWRRYFDEPELRKATWLWQIRTLMEQGYRNLYADISYTVFHFQENTPLLKVFLEDPVIAPRVLFGSDYYMVYNEKYSEKRLSIDLRAALGEAKFWLIANTNPRRYLGEPTSADDTVQTSEQ